MNAPVEFFNSPDGSISYFESGQTKQLTINSSLVGVILDMVDDVYHNAYVALDECYAKSIQNRPFHRWQMASRFIRCNCGELDTLRIDMDSNGLNLEQVRCPLRGTHDCKWEGIICMPARTKVLTERQLQVAALLAEGLNNQEVSDRLFISIHTVHNLISQIKIKLGIKNTRQIIAWYNKR